jgi:hypothetical protein
VDEVLGGLEREVAADRAGGGRVAPTIVRTTAIALGPSKAAATSGLEVMKSTRPPKNGFSRWTA